MRTGMWLGPLLAVALLMVPIGVAAQSPMASLSVGSGSGLPGATGIAVPVSLTSQDGAQVAGLNFDLSYDSSRLAVGGVTIGSAASSAGKSLSWSQPAADRIRVIIVGFNALAIPDGVVAVVSFNVLGGAAAGTSSLTLSSTAASDPTGKNPIPVNASNGSFEVLAPPATNTATATATATVTRTHTPTATSGGPTNTHTPTPTRTLTPTPGGPTNTTAPTNTAGPATQTRTPTITRTPSGAQTQTPTGTSASGTPGSGLTDTPGPGEDPAATQTAQAATSAAEFEAAIAGTATALAEFEAAVRATATALAGGDTAPTPEGGGTAPRPVWSGALLVGSGALALVALAALIAFILLRRRR